MQRFPIILSSGWERVIGKRGASAIGHALGNSPDPEARESAGPRRSHPAGELAVKVTAELTVLEAGDVVRQRVSIPAGTAAGIMNVPSGLIGAPGHRASSLRPNEMPSRTCNRQ